MLEGLAAWVLKSYIGEYVENLNTEHLSIGLLQGEVELENVPLKKDAFKSLGLLVEVKSGFIGHIKLSVPLKHMKSEPWVITLEKLYLVAGPLQNLQYDEAKEKKEEYTRKKAQLKALDEKYKLQSSSSNSSAYSWLSFGTSMATNIVENLQLEVKDVHIRYEDDVTWPGCSFACGVVIKSLTAHSTDESWNPAFVSRDAADMMHKLVDLQDMSFYWDTDVAHVGSLPRDELLESLQKTMTVSHNTGVVKEHEYILEPVSAQAKMKKNTSVLGLRSASTPRFLVDIQLEKIPLALNEDQYKAMVVWMQEFDRFDKAKKYQKWRPRCKMKDNYKEWWHFAIDSNLHLIRERHKRRTKAYMVKRASDVVKYVAGYKQVLTVGSYYADASLKEHMEIMEEEWTVDEVRNLREIALDRVVRQKTAQKAEEASGPNEEQQDSPEENPGLLRRWFPGWGGWYGYAPPSASSGGVDDEAVSTLGVTPVTSESEQGLEQELMDVLGGSPDDDTLLKRDAVFAQLNFCLQSGTVKLLTTAELAKDTKEIISRRSLAELECSAIEMNLESRPRTNGLKFAISVGGLYLHDKMTVGSIMPVLVAPQQRERGGQNRPLFAGVLSSLTSKRSHYIYPSALFDSTMGSASGSRDQRLFQLLYEKNPPHGKANYKLCIEAKPLDIVYNRNAVRRIKEFFSAPESSYEKADLQIAMTAKKRYEELKRQTKAELKNTIDELLEDNEKIIAKRWEFTFDISAPQIIIPENFTDQNTTLVVFDLGHLQFHNTAADLQLERDLEKEFSEDNDEDFVTPSSTPPVEMHETTSPDTSKPPEIPTIDDVLASDLSEAVLHDKIYDRYALWLSDLQVMVGKARDNWKFAHHKGTSPMHVVDKFSITLQFERRLLYTADPLWPNATLSGTLPSLVLHVNEQKIQALTLCMKLLSDSAPSTPDKKLAVPLSTTPADAENENAETSLYYSMYQAYSKSISSLPEAVEEDVQARQALAESRLLLMQFAINRVSLEVQSRERSIAELQVAGVRANFTKRPYDMSTSFTVHSLLVVDAVQTFGPDFELLVASHKNLCLDSLSGSIRDSDPNSPLSPLSPNSPRSPAEPAKSPLTRKTSFTSVQAAVSTALQNMLASTTGLPRVSEVSPSSSFSKSTLDGHNLMLPSFAAPDAEALIKVELEVINSNCPTNSSDDDTQHIANIQFNNLDFIANQHTILELITFLRSVVPSEDKKTDGTEKVGQPHRADSVTETGALWEITADFHRLNVLLMRVEEKDGDVTARKVATATISDTKIKASVAGDLEVEGSLGGLQLLDLAQTTARHQKVFSVGLDPSSLHLPGQSPSRHDMYRTAHESVLLDTLADKAFTFLLKRPGAFIKSPIGTPVATPTSPFPENKPRNEVTLELQIASVCYTHSPVFVKDLSECLAEFKDYIAGVGTSLKYAATEVAMGLVHNRTDVGMSMYDSNLSLNSAGEQDDDVFGCDGNETVADESSFSLKMDAILQTPVVIIPRTPNSSEALVAHLGRISITNSRPSIRTSTMQVGNVWVVDNTEASSVYVEIRDMSMYSVDLNIKKTQPSTNLYGANLYESQKAPLAAAYIRDSSYGTPILHDTLIELIIQKNDPPRISTNIDHFMVGEDMKCDESVQSEQSVLMVTGRVVTPLKLVLSKQVYEQILQTVDHIAPPDDDLLHPPDQSESSSTLLPDIEEEGSSFQPSMSALKLDGVTSVSKSTSREQASVTFDSPRGDGSSMVIKATFEMPIFNVQMTGNLGEGEQGFIDLKLQDFKVNYEKNNPYTKSIELCLQSLVIEDLLQPADSKHRHLMVSYAPAQSSSNFDGRFLSSSCPTSMIDIPSPAMPPSLPSSLYCENVFDSKVRKGKTPSESTKNQDNIDSEEPDSPPSTPKKSEPVTADDMLVHIKMLLVERKCPEFASKYGRTNRFIDVDFNCLDTTINLQTWVVLLDFLGMGAKVHDPENFTQEARNTSTNDSNSLAKILAEPGEVVNTEVDLKVQSFSVILNKPGYELAKASISEWNSHVALRDGNFSLIGQLGGVSLQDQSPHGHIYHERFITTGSQALNFDIVKYGTPDPDLLRDHDIQVKLRMNSVCYIHTQRFMQETLAFCQHFNQLQDLLGRTRAASAGRKITEKAFRSARIGLDIEAGAPIILIPHSSQSTDILVMDMGTLSVHNTFLFTGTRGTIGYRRHPPNLRGSAPDESSCCSTHSFESDATLVAESYVTAPDADPETPTSPGSSAGTVPTAVRSCMMQSVMGGLDQDLRSEEREPARLDDYESPHISQSLNSFFSTMGTSQSYESAIGDVHKDVSYTASRSRSYQSRSRPPESPIKTSPSDPSLRQCLLDVISVELVDIDLFSAELRSKYSYLGNKRPQDLEFPSFFVQRESGTLLKEKCRLSLQVERNLEGDLSHAVPDLCVDGTLSSLHFSLDLKQYKLVRGLLQHNFGEELQEFQRPLMSHLQDPRIQTVLSGNVWKGISVTLDLLNVTTELLVCHGQKDCPEVSLARIDFIKSRLIFESYSDGAKDVDMVSHEIKAFDTRYRDLPANARPNVFHEILKPAEDSVPGSFQMELHFRSTKGLTRFTVLLNSMRLMGIFDWLSAVQDFLMTSSEDPFHKDKGTAEFGEHGKCTSPLSMSPSGIMTKRAPVKEKVDSPVELKVNVTGTELVVVESTTNKDTNAVIVKSTAVLSFRPSFSERPLTCSLQSLEVFSCSLAAEEETAMSIIDPMMVTVELNGIAGPQPSSLGGLLDATTMKDKPPLLEINFNVLNIRLSYNDMRLFKAILNSIPEQFLRAKQSGPPKNQEDHSVMSVHKISELERLGYCTEDCEKALLISQESVEEAGDWLIKNATPVFPKPVNDKGFQVAGFQIREGSICLCLIDDCLDADVPLAELTFSNIHFLHHFHMHTGSQGGFRLTGDYYNRSLSGWEPFIEPWKCNARWHQDMTRNLLHVKVDSPEMLNFNITSSLLELYKNTKMKWTEDFYKQQDTRSAPSSSRRRVPYVPFAIRNHTGCKVWFATVTTTPTRISLSGSGSEGRSRSDSVRDVSEWRYVMQGDELPFLIEEREKIRHKHTHELKVHQLVVRAEGWQAVSPVSVDKVGTYFRLAEPETNTSAIYREEPPARIVFDVTLEGSARKVITVRSGLVLDNRLDDPVDIRMDNTLLSSGAVRVACNLPSITPRERVVRVPAHSKQAMPLPMVHSKIWVRPVGWSLEWCNKAILWQNVTKPGAQMDSNRTCDTRAAETATYRFCVSIYRQHYPEVRLPKASSSFQGSVYMQPGHLISLLPAMRVRNLLPVELTYYVLNTDISGSVKPGKVAPIMAADLTQALQLGVRLENFPTCKELVITPDHFDRTIKLFLYDSRERLLCLWVQVKADIGGALVLSVSAPYWLVNKSGVPLIFKQDGTPSLAAGQFDEHEIARSVDPLLFCYTDNEKSNLCTMRLGRSHHGVDHATQWCTRFSLDSGVGTREVRVSRPGNRPDLIYYIGIEVRQGRGRYCNTNIITFSPRYQLDNRSSHKLAFAQRHLVLSRGSNFREHLTGLPNCTVSFHWPRVDLDQLLCIRIMGDNPCHWSGGFKIDHVDSFHVSMRTEANHCVFVRLDIVLHGATFFVVFSDADHMPPPYRIDNFSEVPLLFWQAEVDDEKLRTISRPKSSVPYAWDEPILPPYITLAVKSGTKALYNMNHVGEGAQLYYENFIYIAFAKTFRGRSIESGVSYDKYLESQELVLDVLPNNAVILKKKEQGKRSQLWRMTAAGELQHEGTSVPRDPRKISDSAVAYILDIDNIALQPSQEMSLTLRKSDVRRRSSQTWRFTNDGRLCLYSSSSLCVQAKDGQFGLRDGGEAILAKSAASIQSADDVPMHMTVKTQKMSPGSGVLSVKVVTDGPTRALQITDVKQQRFRSYASDDFTVIEERRKRPRLVLQTDNTEEDGENQTLPVQQRDLELEIALRRGIGISLVNHIPEELVYLTLNDIQVVFSSSHTGQALDVSVRDIQADNQLLGNYRTTVLLYMAPASKKNAESEEVHSLRLSLHKLPNDKWNAVIYKHLKIAVKKLTLQIEERLLWKLLQILGYNQSEGTVQNLDENSFDLQRALTAATSAKFKRYYFETLKFQTGQITMSMLTSSDLPPDLKAIKRNLGIPLLRFEGAKVELDEFCRTHLFETKSFLLESILLHYKEEFKSQAAKILGSVDFLGSPLGLFNDVTEGISGLLNEGNVGGLVKNLTHGVANSAAKVAGTLSDGVGFIMLDDEHEKERQDIRNQNVSSGSGNLVAGFKGLSHGLLGGVTSIVKQTYSGVKEDGIGGLFHGFGRGVVGTVTKPVTGVLDFASGAASAMSDTSKGSSRKPPKRKRKPRCCHGPGGLLPPYSEHHAATQEYLFSLNKDYTEMFIAIEQLRISREDSMQVLISSDSVYVLGRSSDGNVDKVITRSSYDKICGCRSATYQKKFYIEMTLKVDAERGSTSHEPTRQPLFRCDSESVAQKVTQQINYAKSLYEERLQTLPHDKRLEDD